MRQVVTTSKQDHNWLSKPLCDFNITSASVSNKSAVSWAFEFPPLPRSSQANKIMTSIFIHYPPHWYFSCLNETIFPVHFFLCGVYALRQSAFICKGQLLEFLKCKLLKLHHSYYWMFMEAVVDTKMGIFFPTYVVIVLQTYRRFYCKTISKWAFRAFGLLFILTHKWTCVIYITYMSFAIYLKTSAYRVKVIAIIFDGALFSKCLFWLLRM